MRASDSPRPRRIRRDGWTPERQLLFLQMLAKTRSVAKAAACVRMSRESAYRLRSRLNGELFALAWDSVYAPHLIHFRSDMDKSHMAVIFGPSVQRGLGHRGAHTDVQVVNLASQRRK